MSEEKKILHEAEDGLLLFWCPGCEEPHGCWTGEPNHVTGARWTWNGSMDKPTFSPSLLLTGYGSDNNERTCHSFVNNGKIQFLGDCTHWLASKTVDLPLW